MLDPLEQEFSVKVQVRLWTEAPHKLEITGTFYYTYIQLLFYTTPLKKAIGSIQKPPITPYTPKQTHKHILQQNSFYLQLLILHTQILITYSMEQSPSWEANWVLQLIKKFPAFYGIRKFITILTSTRHLSFSWANSIQSPQPLPTSWRSILILSSHKWTCPIQAPNIPRT